MSTGIFQNAGILLELGDLELPLSVNLTVETIYREIGSGNLYESKEHYGEQD